MFDETPEWWKFENSTIWNVIINGYVKMGNLENAGDLFDKMPNQSPATWNCLIDGYLRRNHGGDIRKAEVMFERMPEKDVVSWTTMVSGLSRNGENQEALKMFLRMLKGDESGRGALKPNDFTIVSALIACARMGALESGVWIHRYITRNDFQLNKQIGAALVEMYAKCGRIQSASQVFEKISHKDLITWSSMISGWAMHGDWQNSVQYFEDMVKTSKIMPDNVVFLSVLMACSHSGMVEKGIKMFDSMRAKYKIKPDVRHYSCMVDMFGRAGRLDEALKFIESMDVVKPDHITWGALFNACRHHKNIELAEFVSKKLQQINPKHHGSYVFLANMYAETGRWKKAETVRNIMTNKNVSKSPGLSCIEADGEMHNFLSGDRNHPCSLEIYKKLDEVVRAAGAKGYVPATEWVLHDIEEEEKEDALGCHSEKLALAFGLLKKEDVEDEILIVKNVRVCGDCHSLFKFVSRMLERRIVVRDNKRFHHFVHGVCSCSDYW